MLTTVRSLRRRMVLGIGLGLAVLLPAALAALPADAAMTTPMFNTPLLLEQQVALSTAPSFAAPIQATLPAGSLIVELNQQTDVDGMLWLLIGQSDLTPLGWVRAVDLLPYVDLQYSAPSVAPQYLPIVPPLVTDVPQFVPQLPQVVLPSEVPIVFPFQIVQPAQPIVVRPRDHDRDDIHHVAPMPMHRVYPTSGHMR
jgi:hypothetical protein